MNPKFDFEEFKSKAEILAEKLSIVDKLFTEAQALFRINRENLTDEQLDELWQLGSDIGHAAGWSYDGDSFWQPSTC